MGSFEVIDYQAYREQTVGTQDVRVLLEFAVRGPEGHHPYSLVLSGPTGDLAAFDGSGMLPFGKIGSTQIKVHFDGRSLAPGAYSARLIIAGEELDELPITID